MINVIEDFDERVEALTGAFQLCRQVMAVSAMLQSTGYSGRCYRDGVLTGRNTFQKYFTQAELRGWLAEALDIEPFPVGPGIFYLFKNPDLEQRFQLGRELIKNLQGALHAARAEIHALDGKISSLELLQQHAMGKDRAALKQWLDDAALHEASRLAEHLDVAPGWESAVETVLGLHLEAVCVDDAGQYLNLLDGGKHPDSMAFSI